MPGNDTVNGGDGNDRVSGGGGNDQSHGGDGNDYLNLGTENDRGWGDAGNDYVQGLTGNDKVWGGDGSDHVSGADGDDVVYGEAGPDQLDGGSGARLSSTAAMETSPAPASARASPAACRTAPGITGDEGNDIIYPGRRHGPGLRRGGLRHHLGAPTTATTTGSSAAPAPGTRSARASWSTTVRRTRIDVHIYGCDILENQGPRQSRMTSFANLSIPSIF